MEEVSSMRNWEEKSIEVPGGTLTYIEAGSGIPVVFVQGMWISSGLWDDTVKALNGKAKTYQVEWPIGGHRIPFKGADLSPHGVAYIVLDFIEKMDLENVVLVGNDTGGAVCQLVVTSKHPAVARISGLLLASVDSYENFPPDKETRAFRDLCQTNPVIANNKLYDLLSTPDGLKGYFSVVCNKPQPEERAKELLANFIANYESRANSIEFLAGQISETTTIAASKKFVEFLKPVTVLWGGADKAFPLYDGERLAQDFPNAKLIIANGAGTFVPLDAPEALAKALENLVQEVEQIG